MAAADQHGDHERQQQIIQGFHPANLPEMATVFNPSSRPALQAADNKSQLAGGGLAFRWLPFQRVKTKELTGSKQSAGAVHKIDLRVGSLIFQAL